MSNKVLENVVLDIQQNSTFCFLNSVVQTVDEELYLLIYSTLDLTFIESVYVNKETLKLIPKKGLLTNFVVQDDFLKCDNLPKTQLSMNSSELLGKHNSISFKEDNSFSLFSFLSNAENLVYVDEETLELNDDPDIKYKLGVYGCTSLTNLKFSETTMTAYVHVVTERGFENRNIIVLDEHNYLKFNGFIVGVYGMTPNFPKNCVEFLGEAVDNEGKHLLLYKVKMLSFYDDVSIAIDTDLINLCCYKSLCMKNALNMLDVIIENVMQQDTKNNLVWSGGTKSHKSDYGVLFKSTGEAFSKNRCDTLLSTIMSGYIIPAVRNKGDNETKEEIYLRTIKELMSQGITAEEKYLRQIIANVMILSESAEEIMANACKYKKQFHADKFKFDKFLYWVRCYLFLNKRRLTIPGRPVLYSNFLKAGTIVTEGFYYGDN